ncbi:hypothetical protein C468_17014 [Halorubrum kocurii JCM 14978]|uniref:Uncharacterized protein n=1 Tax=Halorubrum kocurii JCM 14978 TaxID=1230456 RepID=M0NGA6_9EURY|nr:hypothetical protein C468_17014 [Halorubrum kocurii JCM 14978]
MNWIAEVENTERMSPLDTDDEDQKCDQHYFAGNKRIMQLCPRLILRLSHWEPIRGLRDWCTKECLSKLTVSFPNSFSKPLNDLVQNVNEPLKTNISK